jgi:cytidylate kinase
MALVTLSASYGAGGSWVGPALAERLGVPFVDRVIPTQVAERLAVPLEDACRRDESVSGWLDRLLMSLVPLASVYGGAAPEPMPVGDRSFRDATEQVIAERAAGGAAVILGRAAALVLHDDPRALHVRLDGPPAARVAQAMRVQGIDRETADRRMRETDRARDAYVRPALPDRALRPEALSPRGRLDRDRPRRVRRAHRDRRGGARRGRGHPLVRSGHDDNRGAGKTRPAEIGPRWT